jgi:glycosyltransferase involved in cell wall biosynthesis
MKLAVFTSRFPGPTCTFFARDMRGLLDAGVEIDVFPIYPLEPALWRYVPDILNEKILPRSRVHHLRLVDCLRIGRLAAIRRHPDVLADMSAISGSAIRFGVEPLVKSNYVLLKALAWAQQFDGQYDHVLSYWGNYAATGAYMYHRLVAPQIPFSMFLHAKIDLYQKRIYMPQKLLFADNIIVVCEFNRQFLHQKYKKIFPEIAHKIHVHHLGLDMDRIVYEPNNRPPRKVIAVGRFEQQKGFDFLLRAVAEMMRRGTDVDLELVGDGSEKASLKKLANSLGIGRITFRGWLRFDEVQTALKSATILCHPSPNIGDAVPTVIKEAMAVGTPVIGTTVAGIPELLDQGRCGVLVPPKDVYALADAMEGLLSDEHRRQKYADDARKWSEEKFDLWKNGARLANILKTSVRKEGSSYRGDQLAL